MEDSALGNPSSNSGMSPATDFRIPYMTIRLPLIRSPGALRAHWGRVNAMPAIEHSHG